MRVMFHEHSKRCVGEPLLRICGFYYDGNVFNSCPRLSYEGDPHSGCFVLKSPHRMRGREIELIRSQRDGMSNSLFGGR